MEDEKNPKLVTEDACKAITSVFDLKLSGVHQYIQKFDLALFGADGRGGMQKEITDMHAIVKNVETVLNDKGKAVIASKEISVKRLTAYMVLISSFFSAFASIIVAWIYSRGGG